MSARIAVLTISDGCAAGTREDRSGPLLHAWAAESGRELADHAVVADDVPAIVSKLLHWCDAGDIDVVITTGGTGLGPRDVTPEATRSVLSRDAPGIAEALRHAGAAHTPRAVLSRGIAGTRGRTLIVNVPGSPGAVTDAIAVLSPLVPHIVALLHGDTEH